jgi:hypothetical protein
LGRVVQTLLEFFFLLERATIMLPPLSEKIRAVIELDQSVLYTFQGGQPDFLCIATFTKRWGMDSSCSWHKAHLEGPAIPRLVKFSIVNIFL